MLKLVSSLGVKATLNKVKRKGFNIGKDVITYDIKFKTSKFNAFLCRNQDIELEERKDNYWSIRSIDLVETVPTQCIMVDSPTHTYLCTEHLIPTHNTNKEIKMKGFFDSKSKKQICMKYPLNHIIDQNYWHYTLQLSTYAWMLQKLNPDFVIKDLIMIHFDHNDNQTVYHLDYLKDDVERMLKFYKRELLHKKELSKYQRIEY